MQHTIISVIAAVTVMSASCPTRAADLDLHAAPVSILAGLPNGLAVVPGGSLAWAGENETYVGLSLSTNKPLTTNKFHEDVAVDVKLVTGIAAPEPPAIVLAGMAIGGVFCGRSMLRKRQATAAAKEDRS